MGKRYIEKKLAGHPSMQATVRVYENGDIELVSYETLVAVCYKWENGEYEVRPMGQWWDNERVYTPTTARHLSLFFAEFFQDLSYPKFKKYALKNDGTEPVAHLKEGVNLNYGW